MSYRELIMIDIKEMLRRRAAGQSARHVARETGFDRKTVARYFAAAEALSLSPEHDPTEEEIHAVAERVQARPVADPSEEWKQIAAHRERVGGWLALKWPLKLRKIHTLLLRDHGVTASYDTLRRFAIEELAWRKKPTTVRVADTEPGEVAQVDFGLMGTLVDPTTGRGRRLWVLIVTLVYSRYQFVWPSFEQTTMAVCAGLDAAWRFFGATAAASPWSSTAASSASTPARSTSLFTWIHGDARRSVTPGAAGRATTSSLHTVSGTMTSPCTARRIWRRPMRDRYRRGVVSATTITTPSERIERSLELSELARELASAVGSGWVVQHLRAG